MNICYPMGILLDIYIMYSVLSYQLDDGDRIDCTVEFNCKFSSIMHAFAVTAQFKRDPIHRLVIYTRDRRNVIDNYTYYTVPMVLINRFREAIDNKSREDVLMDIICNIWSGVVYVFIQAKTPSDDSPANYQQFVDQTLSTISKAMPSDINVIDSLYVNDRYVMRLGDLTIADTQAEFDIREKNDIRIKLPAWLEMYPVTQADVFPVKTYSNMDLAELVQSCNKDTRDQIRPYVIKAFVEMTNSMREIDINTSTFNKFIDSIVDQAPSTVIEQLMMAVLSS